MKAEIEIKILKKNQTISTFNKAFKGHANATNAYGICQTRYDTHAHAPFWDISHCYARANVC